MAQDESTNSERLARIESILTYQGKDIDKLATAVEKMANALISKELFNELQTDVKELQDELDNLKDRTKTIEITNRIAGIVVGSIVGVVVTMLVTRLMNLI